ncbi:hypothetical protein GHK79_11860 [Enterococcus faecium]|uniref:hypothetical protein n=1 Tax=Enterococcus faecium TaxID=1352 RepID=UPI001921A257|nr:hypothetical protein [Enterococcus faecium]EHK9937327.1 hypothetical protein [Enterococcus faecium]EME3581665.1 hypothetical protein [Enterococcus faecium]MBL3708505.1 hypothetical protein [Enterococcus faecium]
MGKQHKPYEVSQKIGVPKRTLYRWIEKVEERTRYRFFRMVDPKRPWCIKGVPQVQLFLDDEDVRLLDKLRFDFFEKGLPLDYSIDKNFMTKDDFEQLYPLELRINYEGDMS